MKILAVWVVLGALAGTPASSTPAVQIYVDPDHGNDSSLTASRESPL